MKSRTQQQQAGAVLVVALIILAVVTVLGVVGMRNSTLELRMATSLRDRTTAFQAAETALTRIERQIYGAPFKLHSFLTNSCPYSGQSLSMTEIEQEGGFSIGCFSQNCENGFCFGGSFINPEVLTECRLNDGGAEAEPWKLEDNWDSVTARSTQVTINRAIGDDNTTETVNAKYLVEFLCFVPRSTARVADEEDMLPLYRVTVRATTALNRAEVVLQSTFEGPSL